MTDCVQRHDVAPEKIAPAHVYGDLIFIGKICAWIVAVHAAAYLIAVAT